MAGGNTAKEIACFTCDIVDEYINLANLFTQDLSVVLLPGIHILFAAIVGLWIIYRGLQMMLGQETVSVFGKELIFVMIAGVMLAGQGPELVNTVYVVSLKMMGAAASLALQVGQQGASASPDYKVIGGGMSALVRAAEIGLIDVISMAGSIMQKTRLTNPLPLLYGVLLVVPYVLVVITFTSQVVISIFRIMMLATISPYLMLGFAFGWGRGMATAGVRTLLSSFMVLFGATSAVAILLYAVTSLDIGAASSKTTGISVTDPNFLLALAMGWMGTAFITEATGVANSITGSVLSNTGVGVMTAGAGVSGTLAAKGAKAALGKSKIVPDVMSVGGKGFSLLAGGAGYATGGALHHAQRVAELVRKAKKE